MHQKKNCFIRVLFEFFRAFFDHCAALLDLPNLFCCFTTTALRKRAGASYYAYVYNMQTSSQLQNRVFKNKFKLSMGISLRLGVIQQLRGQNFAIG